MTAELRAAIAADGRSLSQLARDCGAGSHVDAPRLSRFVRGERGLSLEAVDRLCLALGLELVARRPAKRNR